MVDTEKTEIVVVLDRSGSMSCVRTDMEGGFNEFIKKQKEVAGDCAVTLVQFDDKYEVVYEAKPLNDVPNLNLVPRGSTALLDSLGKTINSVGYRLKNTPESKRPGRVLFLVITDGHENSSSEFKKHRI